MRDEYRGVLEFVIMIVILLFIYNEADPILFSVIMGLLAAAADKCLLEGDND